MEHAPFVKSDKKLKRFTRQEVEQHKTRDSLYIIIDSYVFDVTDFLDMHPGGAYVLLDPEVAGKDATSAFFGLHRSEVLFKYARYVIGQLEGEKSDIVYPKAGSLSAIPFGEPTWLGGVYRSNTFRDDHRKLALAMRKFVDEEVIPEAKEGEQSGERPSDELNKKMAELKIMHMRLGPGKHLHGLTLPGGMKGEDYDYLAELVVTQELARVGARGFQDGLGAGLWIGLTPVLNFSTEKQKAEIMPPVLNGDKHIALAISEAFAGSDVAGIRTKAELTPDGKHFIVNGTKKWITNGCFADYFSTAVKTEKGMSMLLIPRIEGVETKPIKTSYSSSAGTAYVTFDDVKVPRENLIGELHKGFHIVLSNFNHERLVMCHFTARQIRLVAEECFKWASQRMVFGKPLIEQPVIRQKLAAMFARCEAGQNWLENVTSQMCWMSYAEQAKHLAGPIAMLKTYLTRCAHEVSDDATQMFGGRGLTRTGMGALIESFQRTYKFDAILGGSEEVLYDLAVRQMSKQSPKAVL